MASSSRTWIGSSNHSWIGSCNDDVLGSIAGAAVALGSVGVGVMMAAATAWSLRNVWVSAGAACVGCGSCNADASDAHGMQYGLVAMRMVNIH